MNLIVNNISIISAETKMAKTQDFIKGINVVTSSGQVGGNWVGKSSMLRSIFHTLGADGCFSDNWENEGTYIYLLDFNIDNTNYLMLRKNKLFKLFDSKRKLIFSVSNREKLAEELIKLFNQKIYLKTHDGNYKLAFPAYNYLLNYIDQNKIEPTNFKSFNYLNSFKEYYSDVIYSHLGLRNNNSNSLKEQQERLLKQKKELEDREKTLNEMNKEIESSSGIILDFDIFKEKLKVHEQIYRELANNINKYKKKINNAYNLKVELETLLNEIDSLMRIENKELNKELKTHKCSKCESLISDEQWYYFHKVKFIDGYCVQRLNVEEKLNQVKREIEIDSQQYEKILNDINNVEKEIFNSSKEIKDGLKALGLKDISTSIIKQIGKSRGEIESIQQGLTKIKKELREIESKKNEINNCYYKNFNELLLKYSVTGIESNIEKAVNKIKVDGTHNNIITVVWLCSLLKTKYEFNPTAVRYPLIFDTPNNANFDKENEKKIFDIIFDSIPEKGQVITSLVGFLESDYKNYNFNKITLDNTPYKLLNKEDYIKCSNKYSFLGF
ncbi:hypothetical protein [Spiroplasma sp. AdecLV25b]|uniref:hypothetical protein n=1 Tax=Spiroplasma sp. AdecLV25b TaxID=3027162 RepID=UPI0027E086AE|nr:hypothetical protein [Spiroplasma sp. AdecLV25b]